MIKILTSKNKKQFKKLIKAASLENMFIDKKKKTFIGYFIGDKLVAVVGFYILENLKMIGFVSAFTLIEYRKQGIYDQLAHFRLNYIKEHFKNYSIYVTTNNKSKHEMEKLGFIIIEPQYRMKLDI
jgi:hypothetical protein